MNEQHENTRLSEGIREHLQAGLDSMDAKTCSQIARVRHEALKAGKEKAIAFGGFQVAAMASVCLALILWYFMDRGDARSPLLENGSDIELISDIEDLELIEDLEFYEWLEAYEIPT